MIVIPNITHNVQILIEMDLGPTSSCGSLGAIPVSVVLFNLAKRIVIQHQETILSSARWYEMVIQI